MSDSRAWTDTDAYPVVSSVQATDRLMLYREGVGQRQGTGAVLPSGGGGGEGVYDLQLGFPGQPNPGQSDVFVFTRAVVLDVEAAQVWVGANPSEEVTFQLRLDLGSTHNGTVTIDGIGDYVVALSNNNPVFRTFAAGDRIRLIAPSPADPNLEHFIIAIPGMLVEEGS